MASQPSLTDEAQVKVRAPVSKSHNGQRQLMTPTVAKVDVDVWFPQTHIHTHLHPLPHTHKCTHRKTILKVSNLSPIGGEYSNFPMNKREWQLPNRADMLSTLCPYMANEGTDPSSIFSH